MGERPWYKRYGADFVHGTLGLTLEEKGAYSLCLDLIYDRGGPIPDEPRWLAGVCGCSVRKWNIIRDRLVDIGKLTAEHGLLSNTRAEREIAFSSETSRKHVESGRKGGEKRAKKHDVKSKTNGLDQAELKLARAFQIPEETLEDTNVSLSETSSDVKARRGKREAYPPDFEAFWQAYPTDRLMSKKKAFAAWRRLDSDARNEVLASLPAFRAYCASKPDYRPVHAVRYITEERCVGFNEAAAKAAGLVFVEKETPEWEAWQKVKRTTSIMSTEHRKSGWWFESKWPDDVRRKQAQGAAA